MTLQLDLLTAKPAPPVADPRAPQAEQPRLSGQCLKILARLEQGPATRRELTSICLNPTARLSDLRRSGHDVRCIERHESGLTVYALVQGC